MERMQGVNGRWYRDGDKWLPSVTTVLGVYPKGHQFQRWLGDSNSYEDAIAKRDAAGDRGTLVHDSIAALIEGQTVELPADADPKVGKYLNGFVNWWTEFQQYGLRVIASEVFLVGNGYAGTCDLIAEIGGDLWTIDYKTSGAVYPSYHLQTAAYAFAWHHMGNPIPNRRGVLWLKSNTKKGWQLVESDHTGGDDMDVFLACKEVFHYEHGTEPVPFREREQVLTFTLETE
jgi:hypothetical protein